MTQLLQVFSRNEFQQAVKQTNAERHARGFASWDHFVAMLYCQLGDAQSLREIIGGLSSCEGRLEQFGMKGPKRSTLSYANRHRLGNYSGMFFIRYWSSVAPSWDRRRNSDSTTVY